MSNIGKIGKYLPMVLVTASNVALITTLVSKSSSFSEQQRKQGAISAAASLGICINPKKEY